MSDAARESTRLSRRDFLGVSAAGGALAAAGSVACAPSDRGAGAGGTTEADRVPAFILDEIEITQLQEGMASGQWSAGQITRLYLERIEDIDRNGPRLRSVIETNPDALTIAEELDNERRAGTVRSPLHGIPILVKDNVATNDRMTTTAGSAALTGSIPSADAWVAARLKAAGAIVLGKANLSEWANFRSTRSSSGWSGRGGQCKNPYVLDRNPCGSSSGSGAAAAASLCAGAIGTETNGSVVCPSSANGLVGVKPTIGLVSRSRIIPIAHSQDTAGPMCRTVRDAALVLGALTGVDPEDAATAASEGNAHDDYTQFLDADGLRGARIGVARGYFGFHPEVDDAMEAAVEAMAAAGATIVDETDIETRQDIGRHSYQVLLYEFKADLNAYLEALGPDAPVKSLEEVIAYNEANASVEMPFFGQEIMIEAQDKGPLTEPEYLEALETSKRLAGAEGIDKVLEEHQLNAIVAPTGGPAWKIDLINGDHFGGGSSTPAAVAGYANITLPVGNVRGLPVGISFFAGAWSEPTLFRLTYAFEQATGHRITPTFIPTLDLANA
jgi:amidase